MVPILIGVMLIVFAIMEMTPGDPALKIVGTEASPEAVQAQRVLMGLDKPFFTRVFLYAKGIVTKFDFGTSWRTGRPVFEDIGPRLPVSIRIGICSIIVSVVLGIPLGVYSAVKQNTLGDNLMRVMSTVFVAMPNFWLGMLLILAFSLYLKLLPPVDNGSWVCYIMPVLASGLPASCRVLRLTRSSMLESIRADYVRTARAKGTPELRVTYRHALMNALLPVVTTVGSSFGTILGGAIISETVFSMSGMGSLMVLSIRSKDTPVIVSSVLLLAFYFSVVILIVDILIAFIDPRTKAKIKNS